MFNTIGIMVENVGEGVGWGFLPGMYIPPLLQLWNSTAINNPSDRTLLPLMECLGSSTVVCRLNYQPWVLETFKIAMSTIEACTIIILHEDDLGDVDKEMMDPIICSVDLINGLVEGLGPNFASLVNGSSRFGPTFPNVLQKIATSMAIPSQRPGSRKNVATTMGQLAMVSRNFVAPNLGRFLLGDLQMMRAVIKNIIDNDITNMEDTFVHCGYVWNR